MGGRHRLRHRGALRGPPQLALHACIAILIVHLLGGNAGQVDTRTALWKFGVTGSGVGVAVIDTGVDGALPDFASSDGSHSRVIVSAVGNPHATTAVDGYGHGTDVAGIIAGNGDNRPASDSLRGRYVGGAPNARLISVKVTDETGATSVLQVIYGLQFAVEHQAQYNIRVVNLSLDSATPQSYKTASSSWPPQATVEAPRMPCSTRRPTIRT